MPVSQSTHSKVLVTGASGFVAAWVVQYLLERGHHVCGTVRSVKKGSYLRELFKEYGNMFEYALVEDISKAGAFDEVCRGLDAVVHTASPFRLNVDDPQDLIGPAVNGTVSILESILKFAPTVKRVVITSSTASVADLPSGYNPTNVITFTEKDWHLNAARIVEEKGKKAPSVYKYPASKVLAEKAAWEFVERHRAEINFDVVALNPCFVFGPVIHEVTSASELNTSSSLLLSVLANQPPKTAAELLEPVGSIVDVRDVAWAHAEALTNDSVATKDGRAALNEGKGRVILTADEFCWQDVVDAIDASSLALPEQITRGETGAGKKVIHSARFDSQRARKILRVEFRPYAETLVDTVKSFREKGWIE